MSFDNSVEIWLESVHEASDSYNGEEDCPLDSLILKAGSDIFGCSINTMADLASTVAAEMDIEITSLIPGVANIARLCLLHAVSSKCPRRGRYVQGIISLDPIVQGELMQIIKGGMSAHLTTADTDGDAACDEEDTERRHEHHNQRKRGREDEEECNRCVEKDKELVHLQATIRRSIEKEEEDSQIYQRELSLRDNKLMDSELQLMQRDERFVKLQQENEHNLSIIRDQQAEIKEAGKAVEQIQELQDEIDVLKPKAAKVEALEATTERLKLKLDEMADLKQQLQSESAAHLKTQNKYVDIVREVDLLRKAKTQLDEYRAKCAELEISGNELAIKLANATRELDNQSGKNENMSQFQKDKVEETQRLTEELQAAQARLREVERSGGVGQGMSELNPEIMLELTTLRSENKKMLTQIDKSSLESLENLEKHLDDAKSINISLQAKWMDTKDTLAERVAEVNHLTKSVSNWSLRYEILSNEHTELINLASEDRCAMILRQENLFRQTCAMHAQELAAEISTREEVIARTQATLDNTSDALAATAAQLKDKSLLSQKLSTDLSEALTTISGKEADITALIKKQEQDLMTAKDTHAAIVELLKTNEKKKVEDIERRHQTALKSVEIEITSISSELDDEKKKRRRVEKEKRFLDSEVHRYKTQAQINGSTSSSTSKDVADMLKEMKAMQKSLDNLSQENNFLRSQSQASTEHVETSAPSSESLLRGGAGRVLSNGTQLRSKRSHISEQRDSAAASGGNAGTSASYGDYLEQNDISDKRIEILVREKREIMAKNLEEGKEKMEMAQKLLQSERENTQLKSKVTKLTLENERYQRKAALGTEKAKSLIARAVTEENHPNLASNYPSVKKSML